MILPIIIVIFSSMLGAIGAFFLKKGSALKGIKLFLNRNTIFGIVIYGVAAIGIIIALKFGDVSVLTPLTSTTYVWSLIMGNLFLNEKINKYKLIGIGLIVIGAFFVVR